MVANRLRRVEFFSHFTDQELEWVKKVVTFKSISPGQMILREGDRGHSLFILESGEVDVLKKNSEGDHPLLSTIPYSSIFGELALAGDGIRNADVVARTAVTVCELPYQSLERLAHDHPELGTKFYRAIIDSVVQKINKTTSDLLSIVFSSRMAALGEMASGIAHEIASPLTIIRMLADGFEDFLKPDELDAEGVRRNASKIMTNVDRIGKLIQSVRAFSRQADQDQVLRCGVQEIVEQTFELCFARFASGKVELRREPLKKDFEVDCRSIQISQVLLNLMNNAYDAVLPLDERWVKLEVQEGKDTLSFIVTDSGKGVPVEVREKMFQSFFTTKFPGLGTGLGLSISLKIAQDHHGTLTLNTQSPNTQFILKLPKCQPKPSKK